MTIFNTVLKKSAEFRDFVAYQALTIDTSMNSRINKVANALLKPLEMILNYYDKPFLMKKYSILNGDVVSSYGYTRGTRWQIAAAHLAFIPATIIAINLKILNRFINKDIYFDSYNPINTYKQNVYRYHGVTSIFDLNRIPKLVDVGHVEELFTIDFNINTELFKIANIIKGTYGQCKLDFFAIRYMKRDQESNKPFVEVIYRVNVWSWYTIEFPTGRESELKLNSARYRRLEALVNKGTSGDFIEDSRHSWNQLYSTSSRFLPSAKLIIEDTSTTYTLGHTTV